MGNKSGCVDKLWEVVVCMDGILYTMTWRRLSSRKGIGFGQTCRLESIVYELKGKGSEIEERKRRKKVWIITYCRESFVMIKGVGSIRWHRVIDGRGGRWRFVCPRQP